MDNNSETACKYCIVFDADKENIGYELYTEAVAQITRNLCIKYRSGWFNQVLKILTNIRRRISNKVKEKLTII